MTMPSRRCSRCRRTGETCMDLDQFLSTPTVRHSQFICQPRFSKFYVRKWIWAPTRTAPIRPTIVLANLRAGRPGGGALKELLARICLRYPRYYVVAECVTARLVGGLVRMGFQPLFDLSNHYWLSTPEGSSHGHFDPGESRTGKYV